MNTPPKVIYLQIYDEDGKLLDVLQDEVTWCVDRINEKDLVYMLQDCPKRMPKHKVIVGATTCGKLIVSSDDYPPSDDFPF